MARHDPLRGHWFQKDVILLAVRWYCHFPVLYRSVRKFGPEIRKRALSRHRYLRDLTWQVDEIHIRVSGRWSCLWRAVDQYGQFIDFRLTPRRDSASRHKRRCTSTSS